MESFPLGSYASDVPVYRVPYSSNQVVPQSAGITGATQNTGGGGISPWIWVILVVLLLLIIFAGVWWWSSSSSSGSKSSSGCSTTPVIDSLQLPSNTGWKSSTYSTGMKTLSTPQPTPEVTAEEVDPLSNPENSDALPSIWIGEVNTENNQLITPGYGYFYPRKVGDAEVRPSVNAATVISPTLYIHVRTPGLEGIYTVDTTSESSKWKLLASTGTNKSEGAVQLGNLDISQDSAISDLYTSEGVLHIVTPVACYKLQDLKLEKVESGVGILGADANQDGIIALSDDGKLSLNRNKIRGVGGLRIRTDIPSYIKYIHRSGGIYAVTTTDSRGKVGYTTGKDSELRQPIEGNVRAFGAMDGHFCCVDGNGRVMINEYDAEHYNFKYPAGIPYGVTVPVSYEFELAVTVGNGRAYIFSCYREGIAKPQQRESHRTYVESGSSSSGSSSGSSGRRNRREAARNEFIELSGSTGWESE